MLAEGIGQALMRCIVEADGWLRDWLMKDCGRSDGAVAGPVTGLPSDQTGVQCHQYVRTVTNHEVAEAFQAVSSDF